MNDKNFGMNEKESKNGAEYRDCILAILDGNYMFPISLQYYLKDLEYPVLMHICSKINRYSQCADSCNQIADEYDLNPEVVRRVLKRLEQIGLVVLKRGYHTTVRTLNLDNIALLCDIIHRHPGIAPHLRKVMGDGDIANLKDGHSIIMAALKIYNEKHGIQQKTRKVNPENKYCPDCASDSISLFG